MSKRGLGRGLDSLLPSVEGAETRMEEIPVNQISPNPNQPRASIGAAGFEELVSSIREVGLLQPVVVRPKDLGFELVAGERRWRAAKEAGLAVVPAVVKTPSEEESLEMALIENLQRENLNALEEAKAFEKLIRDYELTQAEVAKRLGRSRVAVTNTLRLLQLPERIKDMVREGDISSGHARALLTFDDAKEQLRMAERILREGLSVRQAESIARLWQMAPAPRRESRSRPAFQGLSKRLSRALGTNVRVRVGAKKKRLEIEFSSEEDLRRICGVLGEDFGDERLPE